MRNLERESSFSFGSPISKMLDVLDEETEEEEEDEEEDDVGTENIIGNLDRPLKKKRRMLDHKHFFTTPPQLRSSAGLGRSQSHRTPVSTRKRLNALRPGSSTNLGRSQSLKAPERTFAALSRNVTITRGGRSTRVQAPGGQNKFEFRFPSEIQTSTPMKRKRVSSDSDVEMDCDVANPSTSLPRTTSSITEGPLAMSSPMLPSPSSAQFLAANDTATRKLVFGTVDEIEPDTRDVMYGMRVSRVESVEASMIQESKSESDMDVSNGSG